MSAGQIAAAIVGTAVASFAVGSYVFYKYGQRAVNAAVAAERKFYAGVVDAKNAGYARIASLHSEVSAKLTAVKNEVAQIESEAKAEEAGVVARLKKLF